MGTARDSDLVVPPIDAASVAWARVRNAPGLLNLSAPIYLSIKPGI